MVQGSIYIFGLLVAYFLARCKNWFGIHESTGKSVTQCITNNTFGTFYNVAIMIVFMVVVYNKAIKVIVIYMLPIWSNGRSPMTFDTFPKVQVIREYNNEYSLNIT